MHFDNVFIEINRTLLNHKNKGKKKSYGKKKKKKREKKSKNFLASNNKYTVDEKSEKDTHSFKSRSCADQNLVAGGACTKKKGNNLPLFSPRASYMTLNSSNNIYIEMS